jgi:hypothetical protein
MILAAIAAAALSVTGTPSAMGLAQRLQLVEAKRTERAAAPSLVELETERRALEAHKPTYRPSAVLLGTGFGLTAAGAVVAAVIFLTSGGWDALTIAATVLVVSGAVGLVLVVAGFIMLAVSAGRLSAHRKKIEAIDRQIEELKPFSPPPPPPPVSGLAPVAPSLVLARF